MTATTMTRTKITGIFLAQAMHLIQKMIFLVQKKVSKATLQEQAQIQDF